MTDSYQVPLVAKAWPWLTRHGHNVVIILQFANKAYFQPIRTENNFRSIVPIFCFRSVVLSIFCPVISTSLFALCWFSVALLSSLLCFKQKIFTWFSSGPPASSKQLDLGNLWFKMCFEKYSNVMCNCFFADFYCRGPGEGSDLQLRLGLFYFVSHCTLDLKNLIVVLD